jgi:hypothetical protein
MKQLEYGLEEKVISGIINKLIHTSESVEIKRALKCTPHIQNIVDRNFVIYLWTSKLVSYRASVYVSLRWHSIKILTDCFGSELEHIVLLINHIDYILFLSR